MNNNKNCDCAGFFNALNAAIIVVSFFIHPFLSIAVLIIWAVAMAWPDRSRRPSAPLLTDPVPRTSPDQRREQSYRATGREPPPRLSNQATPPGKVFLITIALSVALIATALTAEIIARLSHSDPAEIFPWVVSGSILAFVVVWAKFWRRPDQQEAAP